jgi:hypothetical protein
MALVETSPGPKREQLMKIINNEDKNWSAELTKRMLTAEKFFSWGPEAVEKILSQIPEQTWPKALFHLPEGERMTMFQELIKFQPVHKQKQMLEYISTLKPSQGEIDAAHVFIFKKVRELQASGDFRPERFDPNLSMDGVDRLMI